MALCRYLHHMLRKRQFLEFDMSLGGGLSDVFLVGSKDRADTCHMAIAPVN